MEDQIQKTKAGQGLGIAGFILGAVALVICWIPCLGTWAIFPGGVGIVLSAIALSQASRGNGAKGLIIAALIVSIIGTAVATVQYFAIRKAAKEMENSLNDFSSEWKDAVESNNNEGGIFGDLEDALKDMENEMQNATQELDSSLNEEDWDKMIKEGDMDKVLDAYEKLILQYIEFVKKAEKGDITAITSYMGLASKLTVFSVKLATVMPKLSDEQLNRFNEIDAKYKDYLDKDQN
ncbi:MAG: DUF4190 domain-containing protein [Bacteroidota bacterium]